MLAMASCVAVCSTLVCLAAEPARRPDNTSVAVEGSDTIRLTGTLLEAPRLASDADSGRTAWAVGADPRWLMVVRVDTVIGATAPFGAGTEQRFLIHSPARAFCGNTPNAGQLYAWTATVSREADGTVRFLRLDTCSSTNPGGGRADDGCAGSDRDPKELSASWTALHAHYVKYGGHCEDGAAGEASSEAVLLAFEKWDKLPELKKLSDKDARFGEWVLWHLDGTTAPDELPGVYEKATTACPRGCEPLCARIAKRAKEVADDIRRVLESGGNEGK